MLSIISAGASAQTFLYNSTAPPTWVGIHAHISFSAGQRSTALGLVGAIVESVKAEPDTDNPWYIWDIASNTTYTTGQFETREVFNSCSAVQNHLSIIGANFGALVSSPVGSLDAIEIHAPQATVDCLKTGTPAVPPPTVFFVPWKWSANSEVWPKTATRGGSTGATSTPITISTSPFVTIYNVFNIVNLPAATILLDQMIRGTEKESGNLYYMIDINEAGTAVSFREAYADGDAIVTHVQNVGPVLFCFLGVAGTIDSNGESCEQGGSPLGSSRTSDAEAAPCSTACPVVLNLQPTPINPTPPSPGAVGQFLLQGPPNEVAKTIGLPPPWTRYTTIFGKTDATIGTACTATYQCTTSGTMICSTGGTRTLRQLRSRILRNRDAGHRSLLFGAATTTGSCQIIS